MMAAAFAENAKALRDPTVPEDQRRWMAGRIDQAWLAIHGGKQAAATLAKFGFLEAVEIAAQRPPDLDCARHALEQFRRIYPRQAARLTAEDMLEAVTAWRRKRGPTPRGARVESKEDVLRRLLLKMGIAVAVSTDLGRELHGWKTKQRED